MVNIHITGDKALFQSKTAITRLKNKIRELGDPQLIESGDFLKEDYEFKFKEEKDNVYVDIQEKHYLWGDMGTKGGNQGQAQPQPTISDKEANRQRLKARLKELRDRRRGVFVREMNDIKKSVDKSIFKKYSMIKQMVPTFPVPKPTDLLDDPEKHKQEIQMFASGSIQLTQNPQIDGLIGEYFREISEKVGYPILSREEVNKIMDQNMPTEQKPAEQLPASINLNSYVDSDTESEDSDEEKSEEVEEKSEDVQKTEVEEAEATEVEEVEKKDDIVV